MICTMYIQLSIVTAGTAVITLCTFPGRGLPLLPWFQLSLGGRVSAGDGQTGSGSRDRGTQCVLYRMGPTHFRHALSGTACA